tara:strand:+ start:2013 stop:2120 length:108 start_codon:yes stop_codon:yes gene_type:complete
MRRPSHRTLMLVLFASLFLAAIIRVSLDRGWITPP